MHATLRAVTRPWSLAVVSAVLLMIPAARASLAEPGSVIPGTMEQRLAMVPYISGTVSSVSDHQMVVNTDQGESVELALDSRTLRPADLDRGMNMRVEFKILENGQYYAERIVPIRAGEGNVEMASATSSESESGNHALAADYTPSSSTTRGNDNDADDAAQNQSAPGTPTTQDQSTAPATTPDASTTEDAPKTLPRTASQAPLLLLFGCAALAGAVVMRYVRRTRSA